MSFLAGLFLTLGLSEFTTGLAGSIAARKRSEEKIPLTKSELKHYSIYGGMIIIGAIALYFSLTQ